MMKKLPWLPEYAKAEDASAFLEMATGEAWPLARILEAGAGALVFIAPPEGTPQAVIDAVLGGRSGGFYGPILRQDDLRRLVSSPGDATMHMTQTPEGRVINFNPPARFTSAEVRLHAADVRRIAEMFPDHEVTPSRHSETLRLDGFDVTFAEGHSLRQLMHLHGDIARIDLVESPPVAQSPEPAQATEAPAHAPSASASPAARPEAVAAPAAPEAPDSTSAPAAGLPEPVAERNARRLDEFEELGGRVRVSGGVAVLDGRHGALQELADREKAAGRPRSDRSDIGKGLRAEAMRRHKAMTG